MCVMEEWVVLLLILLSIVGGCPPDCVCKWKGGKQSVECLNRALRTFPPTIDAGTQILDMSGNSFETLPPDHFMRSGLINLQKIYLSKCKLSHINSRAFRGLSNLVELDLSSNNLRDVPSLPDCGGLMRLVLNSNPIPHIPRRAFLPLRSLTTLELSNNGIEIIENGAFEGLDSLEWLKLEGNRLRKIVGLSLLPLGLKGISLEDNPWECDCSLLELRLWLSDRNVANSMEPQCHTPQRLGNATIKSLPIQQFACYPQLSPTTMFQKIGEGKNVSLLCKVVSLPDSTIEWTFNSQPLLNSTLNILVETSAPFPTHAYSTHTHILSPHTSSYPTPYEKKSELLILNATLEENGTFLCKATNPAGTATANFTLLVLPHSSSSLSSSTFSSDYLEQWQSWQLVNSHPNLFLILLSTAAVLLLLLALLPIIILLSKCCKSCRRRKKPASSATSNSMANSSTTKSNVFLLSSPDTDSNPDIIEDTTKRVEGDGLDSTASLKHSANGSNSNLHNMNMSMSMNSMNMGGMHMGMDGMEARLYNQHHLHQNQHHPLSQQGYQHQHQSPQLSMPMYPVQLDLCKYPKEYISPQSPYNHNPPVVVDPTVVAATSGPGPGLGVSYLVGYGVFPDFRCGCIPEGDETEGGTMGGGGGCGSSIASGIPPPPPPVGSTVSVGVGCNTNGNGNGSPDEGYEDGGTEI